MSEDLEDLTNTDKEFEWCLVGNIIDKHFYGESKDIKSGTKYFRAGAKVYCLLEYAGIGHERIRVIGLARNSRRMIDIVIDATLIKNMRVLKVYHPFLIEKIRSNFYRSSLSETEKLERLKELRTWTDYFNSRHGREIT